MSSNIPLSDTAFKALERDPLDDIAEAYSKVQARAKRRYGSRSCPLPSLEMGQSVLIKDPVDMNKMWTTHGLIVGIGKNQDFVIQEGRVLIVIVIKPGFSQSQTVREREGRC